VTEPGLPPHHPNGGEATTVDLRATGDRIEVLFDQLRINADPRVYDQVEELLRLVTELYGAGLARVVELLQVEAPELLTVLVDDELLGSLFVVHGLHPQDLATRVAIALDSVRPFLQGHGGDVELLELDEAVGAVHLRLLGSCDGCPSSAVTLRTEVERAIAEAAPEIVTIDVEEPNAPDAPGVTTAVELGRKPEVAVR
jgi:Fe-S cluster biogenesis protein NfuA